MVGETFREGHPMALCAFHTCMKLELVIIFSNIRLFLPSVQTDSCQQCSNFKDAMSHIQDRHYSKPDWNNLLTSDSPKTTVQILST